MNGKLCMIFLLCSLLSFTTSAQQKVEPEPIGMALVAPGRENGTWYAARALRDDLKYLSTIRVCMINDRVVWPEDNVAEINWVVEDTKIYYSNPRNYYLCPVKTKSVDLHFETTSQRGWRRCMIYGNDDSVYPGWTFEDVDQGDRVLMLSFDSYRIKYYAVSNLGMVSYASRPVIDYPIYDGYVRDITNLSKWGTCCPVRSVTSTNDISGADFYSLLGKEIDENGIVTSLVFEGPCTSLEAGKPYLFKKKDNATNLALIYSGARISEPIQKNGMLGCFEAIPAGTQLTGKYVLYGDKFVQCADGSSLMQYSAYVDLEQVPLLSSSDLPQKVVRFCFDNGTTGVHSLDTTKKEPFIYVYDLFGKCVLKTNESQWKELLRTGTYIVNGKKVFIK